VLVAVVGLLAAGCRMTAGVDLDVERDGGGQLAVRLAADAELLARAAQAGARPLDDLERVGRRLTGDGWVTMAAPAEGGGRSVTLSTRFDNPAELETLTSELAAALAAPELRALEPLRLGLTHDRVIVDGRAGLVVGAAVAEHGLTPQEAEALLAEAVDYRVTVTLPGEVLETNAAGRDGRTLTWPVPLGEEVVIRAVARRPRSTVLIAVAVGAPLAAAAILGLLLLRRR
jgi:hypothetical protein